MIGTVIFKMNPLHNIIAAWGFLEPQLLNQTTSHFLVPSMHQLYTNCELDRMNGCCENLSDNWHCRFFKKAAEDQKYLPARKLLKCNV